VRVLQPANAARFTGDGRTVVTLGGDGRVRYLDIETGAVQRTLDVDVPASSAVVLHGPHNRRFMTASDPSAPGVASVWEVATGRKVWSSPQPDGVLSAISPDGSTLFIGHSDGRLEQVVLDGWETRRAVPSPRVDALSDVAWSPDGSTFAAATGDRSVLVWDAATLETVKVLRGHWGNLTQLTYSPDGTTAYAAGIDRSVVAWDLTGTKGIVADRAGGPAPGGQFVTLAPDASVAATSHPDGRVEVLEIATGETFEVTVPGPHAWLSIDEIGRFVLVHVTPPEGTGSRPVRVHVIE
jgi:WD40 repeat protein